MSEEVEKLRREQYVAEQKLRSCQHREKILERQMSGGDGVVFLD